MLRLATIGCERVVEEEHVSVSAVQRERIQVVTLADPSVEQRRHFGDRFDVPEAVRYADYCDLLTTHATSRGCQTRGKPFT